MVKIVDSFLSHGMRNEMHNCMKWLQSVSRAAVLSLRKRYCSPVANKQAQRPGWFLKPLSTIPLVCCNLVAHLVEAPTSRKPQNERTTNATEEPVRCLPLHHCKGERRKASQIYENRLEYF